MPDFTEEVYFHCQTVESFETEVKGSTGKTYRVWVGYCSRPHSAKFDWQCECKGYKFRGTCKHIEKAKVESGYCGWQQFIHGGEVVRNGDRVARCPKSGDLAHALRYAV